jgi:hypothetical protein
MSAEPAQRPDRAADVGLTAAIARAVVVALLVALTLQMLLAIVGFLYVTRGEGSLVWVVVWLAFGGALGRAGWRLASGAPRAARAARRVFIVLMVLRAVTTAYDPLQVILSYELVMLGAIVATTWIPDPEEGGAAAPSPSASWGARRFGR